MKKNMGNWDRGLRTILALLFIGLTFFNIISGWLAVVLIVFSVVFLLTSFISFCPLYPLFGWNTRLKKETNR